MMLLCSELVQWKKSFSVASLHRSAEGRLFVEKEHQWLHPEDTKLGSDWNRRLRRSGECGGRARVAGLVEGGNRKG